MDLCVRVCVNPVDTTPPKRLEPALDAAAVGASFDHFVLSLNILISELYFEGKRTFLTEIWKTGPSMCVSHTTPCHGNPQNTNKGDPK